MYALNTSIWYCYMLPRNERSHQISMSDQTHLKWLDTKLDQSATQLQLTNKLTFKYIHSPNKTTHSQVINIAPLTLTYTTGNTNYILAKVSCSHKTCKAIINFCWPETCRESKVNTESFLYCSEHTDCHFSSYTRQLIS